MDAKRPNIQKLLAFPDESRDEVPRASRGGSESSMARKDSEHPAVFEKLMEEICERRNMEEAFRRVRANKGAPGADVLTVDDLVDQLKQQWPTIRDQLLQGTYKPLPVTRVKIPKPDGGVRKLGIPTALDRFNQQPPVELVV